MVPCGELKVARALMGTCRLRTMEVGQDSGAVEVETEAQGAKASRDQRFGHPPSLRRADIEHEEATASGSHELAADRASLESRFVVLVDRGVAHLRCQFPLVGPMLVQEFAVAVD